MVLRSSSHYIIWRMHFVIFRKRLKRRTFHMAGRNKMSAQPDVSPPHGARTISEPRHPHYRSFTITLRHTTPGRAPGGVTNSTYGPLTNNTQHSHETDINASDGIRTRNPSKRADAGLRLRQRQPICKNSVRTARKTVSVINSS